MNEWIYQHRILSEVPITLFQVYMKSNLSCSPLTFYSRYKTLLNIQHKLSWFLNIDIKKITESDLLDSNTLNWLFQNFSHRQDNHKLLNQLIKKALQLNYITEPLPLMKSKSKVERIYQDSYYKSKKQYGLSKWHIHTCCQSIYEFFEWLLEHNQIFMTYDVSNIPIQLISNKNLQGYKRYLINRVNEGMLSKTSCSHKLYHLIDFFRYLVRTFGYQNPLHNFKAISSPRYRPRKIPSDEQILNLFNVIHEYSANPVTDTIAYLFMYELGMRLNEVANIRWKDINLELKTIVIHSKGHKSHVLPLTTNLHSYLTCYLQNKKIVNGFLLLHLNHHAIQYIVISKFSPL